MRQLILEYLYHLPKDIGHTERLLRAELSLRMRDFPGEGDLRDALLTLEQDGLIERRSKRITGDTMWLISDEGRAALSDQ